MHGICEQVHGNLVKLCWICQYQTAVRLNLFNQLDIRRNAGASQFDDIFQNGLHADRHGLVLILAAEGQYLVDQFMTSFAGCQYLFDTLPFGRVDGEVFH